MDSPAFSPPRLLAALQALPPASRYWVAFSGGRDSHVLLHALAALRPQLPAVTLAAIHVDHGLNPRSGEWAERCIALCAGLDVPCETVRVVARPGPGESPEAAARDARYAALRPLVGLGELLLTAHHRDDQAETLLLQLLRGGGPRGLAAMPAAAPFGAGYLGRPLLPFSRAALAAYAERAGLVWVDDPSNRDTAFDRNFLRHELLPGIERRWPAAVVTLARAAVHQAETAALLDEVAAEDLIALRGSRPGTLSLAALPALSPPRRRNALRRWLRDRGLPPPASHHLAQLERDLLAARRDAEPCLRWPGAELRRYRDDLFALAPLPPHDPAQVVAWDAAAPLAVAGGTLRLVSAAAGIDPAALASAPLTIRFRRGGERCRPAGRREHHELRKLLQEAGVPPWERQRLPLLYLGERLAAVAGLWVCEPFAAAAGGLVPEWSASG